MKNVHKLTEGAILLTVFTVILLITIYVPILGAVINLFLSLPFIFFSAKNNRKESFVFLVASLLLSLIVGTFLAIPLTLAYGLTGLVIGDFIRHKRGKGAGFIAGSITFLLNLVVQYAVAVAFFKVDFIKQSMELFKQSIEQSKDLLSVLGQEPNAALFDQFNSAIDTLQSLTPSLFVMAACVAVFVIQLVSFPIVKRFGIKVEDSKPFRELALPRNLLFYFLIALLLSLILQPEIGSYLYLALTNIMFIIQLVVLVQGLSFIWYISHLKGWPRAVPIIVTVLLFIMPILLYIVWILGIIDLGFDLRKRIKK
ncbi:YybS family protein [Bacillus sp. V3B]|uniref:YybS family protein n=1 Tax=Bacillus sp. V3B TaxID=2804915 RepID=UPI00210CA805|nr:YybS family protein [Bacillus sp. V3B]MCQ6276663.1 YybS family protein [Bacillus sp. V3B]